MNVKQKSVLVFLVLIIPVLFAVGFISVAIIVPQAFYPGNGGSPPPPPPPPPDPDPDPDEPIPATPVLQVISPNPDLDGSISLVWSIISEATGYQVYMSKNNADWQLIKTTGVFAYVHHGLTSGNYRFKMRAYNSVGYSAFSSIKSVTVSIPDPIPDPIVVIPDEPILEDIIPNPNINGEINLQWNSISGATIYTIYCSKDGESLEILEENIEVNSYTDSVSENGVYSYQVKAGNSEGYSGYSNEECVTVQLTNIPTTPVINQIDYTVVNETTEVQLDWDGVICESYNIYRSINNGDYALIEENTFSTSYSEVLTETGIWLISYRVSAVNEHGESGLSVPMSINITPEGEPLADYAMLYALLGFLVVLVGATVILLRMRKKR